MKTAVQREKVKFKFYCNYPLIFCFKGLHLVDLWYVRHGAQANVEALVKALRKLKETALAEKIEGFKK